MKNKVTVNSDPVTVPFDHAPAGAFCEVISVVASADSWMRGMVVIRPNGIKQHAILLARTCYDHEEKRLLGIDQVRVIPDGDMISILVGGER